MSSLEVDAMRNIETSQSNNDYFAPKVRHHVEARHRDTMFLLSAHLCVREGVVDDSKTR